MRVLGIDLSLRATGLVLLPDGWIGPDGCDWSEVRYATIGESLKIGASETARIGRVDRLAIDIVHTARLWNPTHCVLEQYAFRADKQAYARAELGGCVKRDLFNAGFAVDAVHSSTARKTLLGKLPRGKGVLKPTVQIRLREMDAPFWRDDNQCDAFVVANHWLSAHGAQFVGVAA